MNFTPKQLNILKFIYNYQQQHSCSPTYKEIGLSIGVSGVTVYEHLCALEKKGAITRRAYDARSVELTSLALNLMVKKSTAEQLTPDPNKVLISKDLLHTLISYASSHPDAEDDEDNIEAAKALLEGK